jgi:predicted transcriptional regulator
MTDKFPSEFLARLGDLQNCERIDDPLDMISSIKSVFDEAEEWHLYMAPIRITSHDSMQDVVDQLNNGIKIRNIEETDYKLSARSLARTPKENLIAMQDHWVKGNMDYRYLDEINIRIYMSEKEVSLLSFPKIDGEVDLLGFTSSDPKFHRWCKDIFDYYWARGKTKTTFWTQLGLDES